MPETSNITTSGGLISQQFIENLRQPRSAQRFANAETFGLPWEPAPTPHDLESNIATTWELLLERWEVVRAHIEEMDVSTVRSKWLAHLFTALDFKLHYLRKDIVVGDENGLKFTLSHRGWEDENAPIVHSVAPSQDLNEKQDMRRGSRSPHDLVQLFLNATGHRWSILTNGIVLRLLRDFHHTYLKGYVEFDLRAIFETRNYGDFRALYRLAHASRFIPYEDGETPLEFFYKESINAGVAVGMDLQKNVKSAIEFLGNGFLTGEHIGEFQKSEETCRAFYAELLRVIYRILFLLFAEQRGMMPGRNSLYAESYSMAALRARAEVDIPKRDDHTDLWEGLKVTFRMVQQGAPELDIFAYNGMLFDEKQTPMLNEFSCRNSDLLRAIHRLTLIEKGGVTQRISFADLGVEEIGAIYESLLEYAPRVTEHEEVVEGQTVAANTFFLDPRSTTRKTTGSYYTNPGLVNELIQSALKPVVEARLAANSSKEEQEKALLSMKVCDPACGSGAFLIAANNYLAQELAKVRTGEEYPAEREVSIARRDVLSHCIYGVDLNAMAVELCKVSLWIDASVEDKPLNFLDHHIKLGNSLIGTTPELLESELPDEAFNPVTGDSADWARKVKARNRSERELVANQLFQSLPAEPLQAKERVAEAMRLLIEMDEYDHDSVERKAAVYQKIISTKEYGLAKLEADLWTSAFFWPLKEDDADIPTQAILQQFRENPDSLPGVIKKRVQELAAKYKFFHWYLEFADVFAQGGFDVVLCNPPWERIKLQEQEFFATLDPEIANAPNKAARARLIKKLPETNPMLWAKYREALRDTDALSKYLRAGGRYPLTARGDINTYSIFSELFSKLNNMNGRAGFIVPTGIATDDTNKHFFVHLVEKSRLVSLFDFENRERLFPSVHSCYKFSLLTLYGGGRRRGEPMRFAFFLTNTDHLRDEQRIFELTAEDFERLNPNTRTCPIFRTRADAELTRKIYERVPVLINEVTGENPWGVRFMAMFHMSNDSYLFRTRDELERDGFQLLGNRFVRPGVAKVEEEVTAADGGVMPKSDEVWLPLYEAKMIWQFDHRFGTYEGVDSRSSTNIPTPTLSQHSDPTFTIQPWYWVQKEDVNKVINDWQLNWFIGFRDITNATNERTAIFSALPRSGVGNNTPLLFFDVKHFSWVPCLLGNVSALAFDFFTRQKIAGTHMNFFYVEQLPALLPLSYTQSALQFITPRVLELVYTAWDIKAFADDVWRQADDNFKALLQKQWNENETITGGHEWHPPEWAEIEPDGIPLPPFKWDEERRAHLRAQLDAYYAHLYGLDDTEIRYILDPVDVYGEDFPGETFRVLKENEIRKYGEYRTKRLVLKYYEELKGTGIKAVGD